MVGKYIRSWFDSQTSLHELHRLIRCRRDATTKSANTAVQSYVHFTFSLIRSIFANIVPHRKEIREFSMHGTGKYTNNVKQITKTSTACHSKYIPTMTPQASQLPAYQEIANAAHQLGHVQRPSPALISRESRWQPQRIRTP